MLWSIHWAAGARLDMQPMQPGDVPATYADVSALQALRAWLGAAAPCPLGEGVQRFVDWYRRYHPCDEGRSTAHGVRGIACVIRRADASSTTARAWWALAT